MSYKHDILTVTKSLEDGHAAAEIGNLVSLLPSGKVNTAQDAGPFGVLVMPVSEMCEEAEMQIMGVAKVKIKAGEVFEAGDDVFAGTGADAGFAVTTGTDVIGYALDPSDEQEFVAVKLTV